MKRNLSEKIVISSDMQKICSSSRPTRTNAIDQSLNHVSYNTSRIKTVWILTVGTKKTRREKNKKSYDLSNTGLINQAINMVSGIENINSKAVNNCRNNIEARQTKTLIKFRPINSDGIV